jgi:hypothetical protein
VVLVFGPYYLRTPNEEETACILAQNEARGFPGIHGSIDCMPWKWKKYPFAWKGMYKGQKVGCCVVLEDVADQDLFGMLSLAW